MLHPLQHVGDHQNPLADTPALVSCQAPQLRRPRLRAKKVNRHLSPTRRCTSAVPLYHILRLAEPRIIRHLTDLSQKGYTLLVLTTFASLRRVFEGFTFVRLSDAHLHEIDPALFPQCSR